MIKVLKSGFFSTIQDEGRFGHLAYGVPVSGAMDSYSSQFANELIDNTIDAAVLEMTMTGAELLFLKSTTIAITGADMNPVLNGNAIDMYKSITVKPDDTLSFGRLINGFRTYIAVKGGFLSESVLGSRSMLKGITDNSRIHKGDYLEINTTSNVVRSKNAKLKFNPSHLNADILDVTKGPEFDRLTKSQQTLLFSKTFQVSKNNNRMAYQLDALVHNKLASILTSPVLPGTVQLTPSGQLIVLMRDCQTTGGYPRILQLPEKSINMLSQKTARSSFKLRQSVF
ncbi:biotin-dependent carboxyltransferase family protein [Winogradskyella sp. F6397]|uniref:Biotin-dependent carboxyltransferase family protein n=1 Tax=Winogradskyella marina TaxID=2785530 RepID=A0ABS0EK64_9FLAO|nr:biotin-dependent carboxyltransferase family protein [Winogradskyella marina]MBF8149952.1 biotin-dependent carboxyltransferase family protein [Winogradskyella marina]